MACFSSVSAACLVMLLLCGGHLLVTAAYLTNMGSLGLSYSYNGRVQLADFNNDGNTELLVVGFYSPRLYTFSSPNFVPVTSFSFNHEFRYGCATVADLDNDGDLDFIVSGQYYVPPTYYTVSYVYKNMGNLTFETISPNPFPGVRYCRIFNADINHDNLLDVFVGGVSTNGDRSVVGLNHGNFSFSVSPIPITSCRYCQGGFFDYNLDGDMDLLLFGYFQGEGYSVHLLLNSDSKGTFFDLGSYGFPAIYSGGDVQFVDINRDGMNDVVIAGYSPLLSDYVIIAYRNFGLGSYSPVNLGIDVAADNVALSIADFTGDGYVDIMVVGRSVYHSNGTVLMRSLGSSFAFVSEDQFVQGSYPMVSSGFINSDSYPDAVLMNSAGVTVVYGLYGSSSPSIVSSLSLLFFEAEYGSDEGAFVNTYSGASYAPTQLALWKASNGEFENAPMVTTLSPLSTTRLIFDASPNVGSTYPLLRVYQTRNYSHCYALSPLYANNRLYIWSTPLCSGSPMLQRIPSSLQYHDFPATRAADFNLDGRVDLLRAGWSGFAETTVLFGGASPFTFEDSGAQLFSCNYNTYDNVIKADFDNDGDDDIIVSCYDGLALQMHLYANTKISVNSSSSPFVEVPNFVFPASLSVLYDGLGSSGDFDGDGLVDVVLVGRSSFSSISSPLLLRNLGNMTFAATNVSDISADVPKLTTRSGALLVDVNNDGRDDLIVYGRGNAPGLLTFAALFRVFLSLPDEKLEMTVDSSPGTFPYNSTGSLYYPSAVTFPVDFDADDEVDFMSAANMYIYSGSYYLYRSPVVFHGFGNGSFVKVSLNPVFPTVELGSPTSSVFNVADFNRDGLQEILVTSFYHRIWATVLKNLTAVLMDSNYFLPRFGYGFGCVSDLDGDGTLDLVIDAQYSPSTLSGVYTFRVIPGANPVAAPLAWSAATQTTSFVTSSSGSNDTVLSWSSSIDGTVDRYRFSYNVLVTAGPFDQSGVPLLNNGAQRALTQSWIGNARSNSLVLPELRKRALAAVAAVRAGDARDTGQFETVARASSTEFCWGVQLVARSGAASAYSVSCYPPVVDSTTVSVVADNGDESGLGTLLAIVFGSFGGGIIGLCCCLLLLCLLLMCLVVVVFLVVVCVAVLVVALLACVVVLVAAVGGSAGGTALAMRGKMKAQRDRMWELERVSAASRVDPQKLAAAMARTTTFRELSEDDLEFGRVVGTGAYGSVYIGRWQRSVVAIKVLNVGDVTAETLDDWRSEATLMAKVSHHPNIVKFIGAVVTPERLCLVLEYCPEGSLLSVLKKRSLTLLQRVSILRDAAAGLGFLHSQGVVHRDVASRNVLIGEHFKAYLSDFGYSRLFDGAGDEQTTKSNVGPVRWMAPESLRKRVYSTATDAYSFGMLIFEVLHDGEVPFSSISNLIELSHHILHEGLRPAMRPDASPELASVAQRLWSSDPGARPEMDAVYHELEDMFNRLAEKSMDEFYGGDSDSMSGFAGGGESSSQYGSLVEDGHGGGGVGRTVHSGASDVTYSSIG